MVALDGTPFTSNQGHRGLPPADLGLTPEQRFLMDLQGVSLGGGWGGGGGGGQLLPWGWGWSWGRAGC